ncbi:MAG: peptidoglycan DD-metalloendopeptidase family protein [Wenzhouxiangellaceae bacterium]|nr:peptidoglycan DD-metalloendopeptidase family protein [Wenzhouxiangellaceae bacterium]
MPRTKTMASRRNRPGSANGSAPGPGRLSSIRNTLRAAGENAGRAWRALRDGGPARLALIGGLSALALVVMGLQFSSGPAEPAPEAQHADVPVQIDTAAIAEMPEAGKDAGEPDDPDGAADADPVPREPAATAPEEHAWQYVQVASGDSMEIIFRRLGLSPRLLHEVINLDERTDSLVDLRPGDEIAFDIDDDGLNALRTEFDDENWLFIERSGDGLASRLEGRNLEVRVAEVEAEITSSLFNAGKNAGLSDNMILRLAGIFGWDIDFALDIRRGDRFALVYEEIYRDDQFLRQGAILGARFINQGDSFAAVRFDAGNGPDYYDPEGRPMRKAFLRAPINFTRVSSNFNPRRLHPVTRRVRPHNGTDYAAPTGTPVWAAGDGTVIEAGYTRANGNYIFLKHGNHIVTRYLHLSKKLVGRGDRVRQGQSIGRVGATGMATGPHLHYEFLVNGRHRDPRKVDLPEAEPLPADLLPEYEAHASSWLARLEELLPPKILLASSDDESESTAESRRKSPSAPK